MRRQEGMLLTEERILCPGVLKPKFGWYLDCFDWSLHAIVTINGTSYETRNAVPSQIFRGEFAHDAQLGILNVLVISASNANCGPSRLVNSLLTSISDSVHPMEVAPSSKLKLKKSFGLSNEEVMDDSIYRCVGTTENLALEEHSFPLVPLYFYLYPHEFNASPSGDHCHMLRKCIRGEIVLNSLGLNKPDYAWPASEWNKMHSIMVVVEAPNADRTYLEENEILKIAIQEGLKPLVVVLVDENFSDKQLVDMKRKLIVSPARVVCKRVYTFNDYDQQNRIAEIDRESIHLLRKIYSMAENRNSNTFTKKHSDPRCLGGLEIRHIHNYISACCQKDTHQNVLKDLVDYIKLYAAWARDFINYNL
jgi:hypothetical protein